MSHGDPDANREAAPASGLEYAQVAESRGFNADAFFAQAYDDQLRDLVREIAGAEGPVRDTVLARRIARLDGRQRTGRASRSASRQSHSRASSTLKKMLGCSSARKVGSQGHLLRFVATRMPAEVWTRFAWPS